jgi:hypothetical protein
MKQQHRAPIGFGHFRVVTVREVPLLPQSAFIHAEQHPTDGSLPSWQLFLMQWMMNLGE